jgi:hypothetical protein
MPNILAAIIGGAFRSHSAATGALGDLQTAGFLNAQLREPQMGKAAPIVVKPRGSIVDNWPSAQSRFVGVLTSLGFSKIEAKYLAEHVRLGGAVVTVRAGNRASEASGILQSHGGDLGSRAKIDSARPKALGWREGMMPLGSIAETAMIR